MKKNKFLFGKRSKNKKWAPGLWDIVGGHALPGEAALETLKRETHEEVGITVLNARLLTSLDVPNKGKSEIFRYHIYMITSWKGSPFNASHEHSKIKWLTREQLAKRKLAMPVYLQLIEDWLGMNS